MAWIWLAFFLSGVAGLSYELTWLRYLIHLFGASTPAVSATVAVFFTGLALGAWLGGRVFDKVGRPIVAYAALELCIGLTSALVPFAFLALDGWLTQSLPGDGVELGWLLLGSLGLLIVPTTLLGATFPAMAAVLKVLDNPTGSTGLFYGLNTLGAVVGCLLVSFWALPAFGPSVTTWLLAGLNAAIASAVVLAGRKLSVAPPGDSKGENNNSKQTHLPVWAAMVLAGCSGFVSIAVEVVWVRGLALSFPASIYVFALVLSAYLVGIGFGSLAVGRVFRDRAPKATHLAGLYLTCGMGVWLTLLLFPLVMPLSLEMLSGGWVSGWGGYIGGLGVMSVGVMLPATLAMGAALPMLVGLSTRSRGDAGHTAGRLYAINTLAGVAGSLAGTFVLMPWVGASRILALMAGCFAFMGLGALALAQVERKILVWVGVIGALVVVMGVADLQPEINPRKARAGKTLRFYQDDASATVTIHEDDKGAMALRLNNQYGLSNTAAPTVEMQYTLGHLPMLLHPAPKRALLIGFATGTTLAAMAEHDAERVDCVEIHGLVMELAPWFDRVNQKVYDNPKVRLVAADGRRFLAAPGSSYDVIVGDLYLPRNPGVGALFSLEHFQSARRRLAPGGVFVAWLPLFQMGPKEVASVTRTFLEVFPDAEAWVGNWVQSSPVLGLVGRAPGAPLKMTELGEALTGAVRTSMTRVAGVDLPPGGSFIAFPGPSGAHPGRKLLGPEALRRLGEGAPLNDLEHPVVEFSAPRSMMDAAVSRQPLSEANISALRALGDLSGTPWAGAAKKEIP